MITTQWQSLLDTADWSLCTIPFMVLFIFFMVIFVFLSKQSYIVQKLWVIAFNILFAILVGKWAVLLLLLNTFLSWFLTKKMDNIKGTHTKKWALAIIIFIELLPLFFLKYAGFTFDIIHNIISTNISFKAFLLPVGISFYTFQAVSYTIDVYRKRIDSKCSLFNYTFYLTFFPLLIAGPITRAKDFLPQLYSYRKVSSTMVYRGLWLILCGIVKKCVIADYLSQYNNFVFADPLAYTGFENLIAVIGFSLQIYYDFAGYSDLAIGIAAIMGFHIKDNFYFPYQSVNLTEFWHRWHISLSTWFRDYLYIPLGGNRHGAIRTYYNVFIVMVIAGLWHGASWMFAIWGVMHGVGLVLHKLFYNIALKKVRDTVFVHSLSWLVTFSYITVAWIFFRAQDMSIATDMLLQIFHHFDISSAKSFIYFRPLWTFIFIVAANFLYLQAEDYNWLQAYFVRLHWVIKLVLFIIVLQLVINMSQDSVQPFIYMKY